MEIIFRHLNIYLDDTQSSSQSCYTKKFCNVVESFLYLKVPLAGLFGQNCAAQFISLLFIPLPLILQIIFSVCAIIQTHSSSYATEFH